MTIHNDEASIRRTVVSRRKVLQVGSLGLAGLGLSLPNLLANDAGSGQSRLQPLADNCILLFLNGGPSHLDMWDPKPNAPDGIRGEFQTISTSLPGYHVGEYMPRMAQQMHLATVVRSMHHSVNNSHAAAVYASLTGHDRGEQGGGTKPTDHPSLGGIMSKLRPTHANVLPQVHLPYMTKEGAGGPPQPGFFGGFLGHSYDPLFVLQDPNAADFRVPELTLQSEVTSNRLTARRQLFEATGIATSSEGRSAQVEMSQMQGRALDILSSETTQRAFRLSEESATTRDSYGRNIYGQSTLLARRLIEAGTRVVTISWAPDANATWDTHGNNFKMLKSTLVPQLDAACSSLVADLLQRGMLDRTLVAVFGDFGRTPKINANAGRDHWNFCYSLMLIGGGFQRGLIYGSSDSTGAFPASHPLVPGDIICTIYRALGILPTTEIFDQFRRPYQVVPGGDIVNELLA